MKIRKTRVKKTTKANGSVYYVAEYKWGFWWYQFDDCMGPSGNARYIFAMYIHDLERGRRSFSNSEEQEAKAFIDSYIAYVNYQNACEMENKVVKVEYEGYP